MDINVFLDPKFIIKTIKEIKPPPQEITQIISNLENDKEYIDKVLTSRE